MADVNLKAIAEVVQAELKLQLDPINTKLEVIAETVSNHTTVLDVLVKDVKNLNAEMKVVNYRFDKNEKAVELVAQKVGLTQEIKQVFRG